MVSKKIFSGSILDNFGQFGPELAGPELDLTQKVKKEVKKCVKKEPKNGRQKKHYPIDF